MLAASVSGRWPATVLVGVTCAIVTYRWLPGVMPSSAAGSLDGRARAEVAESSGASKRATPADASGAEPSRDALATTQQAVVQALLHARADEPKPHEPTLAARETFDRRMADAAPDPANTARMEQAIDAAVASGALGSTTAERVCGASLCRIDLANADAAQLNESIGELSRQLAKSFVRSLVIPTRDGERALYLATDAEVLALAPPSQHRVVVPAPSQ